MASPANKIRLDQALVDRDLCDSREMAQRLIRAGEVRVGGQVATKPGHTYGADVEITVATPPRYVSRGGDKLAGALAAFPIEVAGRTALDVGASTGGFTDCLLQAGTGRVIAVDVGKGQLHWKLRQDPRVDVMENVNARYLDPSQFPKAPSLAVIDVSFISLTKILPAVSSVLAPGAELITLIKPQFEAGRQEVGKGGVVKSRKVHEAVILAVRRFGVEQTGLRWRGLAPSPLRGPAGNREFFAWWEKA